MVIYIFIRISYRDKSFPVRIVELFKIILDNSKSTAHILDYGIIVIKVSCKTKFC